VTILPADCPEPVVRQVHPSSSCAGTRPGSMSRRATVIPAPSWTARRVTAHGRSPVEILCDVVPTPEPFG